MFANITVERDGIHNMAAELRSVGTHVQRVGPSVVRNNAKNLQAAVRAHAEGRPGPQKITGKYWDSIQIRQGIEGSDYPSMTGRISRGFEAEVYTDEPYARRLEFGFVGADSKGRVYNQPPFPHWAPAVAETEFGFYREMASMVDLAVAFGKTR